MEIEKTISTLVQEGMVKLSPSLREWVKPHLIFPKKQAFVSDPQGKETTELWLVTDHNGDNDSSCRVVFDEDESMFGLEATLEDGTNWFMGLYGTFDEAIEHM